MNEHEQAQAAELSDQQLEQFSGGATLAAPAGAPSQGEVRGFWQYTVAATGETF